MEENFRKYFQLFSKTILLDLGQNRLISQDFSKLKRKKEKSPKLENLGWLGL